MTLIADILNQVIVGEPVSYLNLALFPILMDAANDPDYLVLDEAIAGGCARVTEVDEDGSVPELKFFNGCDKPVLLLDGEELVGAKQNRILNLTVLAPANSEIVIPVSCVEAGRWNVESAEFSSSDRAHYASGRASKMRSVSDAMRVQQDHRSDQSEIWADISEKAERMASYSETEAAAALYESNRPKLEEFLGALKAQEHQAGALFAINDRLVGLELFDSARTFGKLSHKLVQSYALDAIDDGGEDNLTAGTADIVTLMDEVTDARVQRFPGVGMGEDLRLSGKSVTGGALEAGGKVVHLCVFRLNGDSNGPGRGRGARMVRASRRGNRYTQ